MSARGPGELFGLLQGAPWEADGATLDLRSIDPVVVALFGHAVERWTRAPAGWAELILEDDRARVVALRRGVPAGRVETLEYRLRAADGEVRWAHDRFTRLGDGALLGVTFRAERPEGTVEKRIVHDLNNVLTTLACHLDVAARGDPTAIRRGQAIIADAARLGSALMGHLPGRAGRAEQPARPAAERGAGVLVVEDEAELRRLMGRVLTREGFEVQLAEAPRDAIERLDEHTQLLITDLTLSDGACGRELLLRARRSRPGLRAIVTSGAQLGVAVEGAAFLAKPFTPRDLAAAARAALAAPPPAGAT